MSCAPRPGEDATVSRHRLGSAHPLGLAGQGAALRPSRGPIGVSRRTWPTLHARICEDTLSVVWQPQSAVKRSFGDGDVDLPMRCARPLRSEPSPNARVFEAATQTLHAPMAGVSPVLDPSSAVEWQWSRGPEACVNSEAEKEL